MEQIPPIAVFLQESRSDFPVVLSEYLTPIVVRYLTDPNNQVWKTGTWRSVQQIPFSLILAEIHNSENSFSELSDSRTKDLFVPGSSVMQADRQHSLLVSWEISFLFFLTFSYGNFQTQGSRETVRMSVHVRMNTPGVDSH